MKKLENLAEISKHYTPAASCCENAAMHQLEAAQQLAAGNPEKAEDHAVSPQEKSRTAADMIFDKKAKSAASLRALCRDRDAAVGLDTTMEIRQCKPLF
jgi:hypothetical protein